VGVPAAVIGTAGARCRSRGEPVARALDCDCGHHLEADDDEQLFERARKHVDDVHPEMQATDDQVRGIVAEKAYDASG
jgi:predicted small metal-binding protein